MLARGVTLSLFCMQNLMPWCVLLLSQSQVVERFTANYVFALGVARFLSCAHWILQVRLRAPF